MFSIIAAMGAPVVCPSTTPAMMCGGVGLAAFGRGLVATGGATVEEGLQLLLVHGDARRDAVE